MLAGQLTLDLPMNEAAPALARRAIERLGLGQGARETATLLVSELVSNALRHSGAGTADSIELRVSVGDDALRLSVTDSGDGFAAGAPRREPGVGGGFGLFLVERLAADWGVERGLHTTVWLELALGRA